MYWYLKNHAEDVYEELQAKTRDLQEEQIQMELDAFLKEQCHMPRELSDWTPERRLGKKVRREAPDLRDKECKEEQSSLFKAFLEDFREFSERNRRTPRRTSDNENERHLAIRLDHARRGHGFFPLDPETVARDVRKCEDSSVSARTSERLEWQRRFEEAAKEKQEEAARDAAQDDASQYAESESGSDESSAGSGSAELRPLEAEVLSQAYPAFVHQFPEVARILWDIAWNLCERAAACNEGLTHAFFPAVRADPRCSRVLQASGLHFDSDVRLFFRLCVLERVEGLRCADSFLNENEEFCFVH